MAVNKEPPRIAAKDLRGAAFLAIRAPYLQLDSTPFLACYVVLLFRAFQQMIQGTWVNATELKFILGGLVACHVLLKLFAHWFVGVRCFVQYSTATTRQATHVKVTPAEFTGHEEIVRLDRHQREDDSTEINFEFRKQRYCYSETEHSFQRLHYPDKERFEYYWGCNGYSNESKILAAVDNWGANKFHVPLPSFMQMLQEQLLAPFFVFQTFCVGLWCLDEYWYYSLFTLGMLVTFECTLVLQRTRQLTELRGLQTARQSLQVYRHGKWDRLPGEAILPGDLISIGRPAGPGAEDKVVPADVLLMAGTCIVEEAVLTGESTPQWKMPIRAPNKKKEADGASPQEPELDPLECLNIARDKQHVLFGGTKILQHTPDKAAKIRTPDGGCLAVVLRTGFETSQGQLMRTILFSTERVTGNNWETGLFILFLLIFAVSASGYVLYYGLQDPDRNRFKLFLNCTMIITSVIPPELPMELSIAVNTSLLNLARKFVFCTEPFRIPIAGKGLQKEVQNAPWETLRVLACCQALIQVDGELVGDPLERAAFLAAGWTHTAGCVSSPKQSGVEKETCTILHRFHFSSALKRMSAIVKVEKEGSNQSETWLLTKGAPEVVHSFLKDPPAGYDEGYKEFAAQGGRVIALAAKQLPGEMTAAQLRDLTREEAESDLVFAGFAVLQCPLKPESEPALRMLKEASHQLVMITGDAPLTACHAASSVHIVDRPVLILGSCSEEAGNRILHHPEAADDNHLQWSSPDEATSVPFSRQREDILQLASEYDLCISGDGLTHIHKIGADASFVPLVQVFARVSPDQKELILRTLRAAGWVTLMCGDGTNDVGALKTAHVGVALLSPKEKKEDLSLEEPSHRGGPGRGGRGQGRDGPSGRGVVAGRGVQQPGNSKQGQAAKPPVLGPGAKMLEEMRKKGKPIDPKMERMANWMDSFAKDAAGEGAMGEAPMVKPGDASMASPFTAKQGNVMPCTDIIKQGRSTLVTTVQMFKILGLLCLSTAYSLSVMYLQGVKVGDLQATAQGFLSAYMFFVISNGKPLERLSQERPHPSIFCAYVFLSVLGQFALHMSFLIYMYFMAIKSMPEDHVQKPDTDFEPNLVNTVCFLVQWVVQLTTFAVNYLGHPFNQSLTENKGLALALRWGTIGFIVATTNIVPGTDWALSLVGMPSMMRVQLLAFAFLDYSLSLSWETFLRKRFPAACPPQKGYLALQEELKGIHAKKLTQNGDFDRSQKKYR